MSSNTFLIVSSLRADVSAAECGTPLTSQILNESLNAIHTPQNSINCSALSNCQQYSSTHPCAQLDFGPKRRVRLLNLLTRRQGEEETLWQQQLAQMRYLRERLAMVCPLPTATCALQNARCKLCLPKYTLQHPRYRVRILQQSFPQYGTSGPKGPNFQGGPATTEDPPFFSSQPLTSPGV